MADDRDARIAQLEAELRQARLQSETLNQSLVAADARESALTEILRTMNATSADIQPVLDAIVRSASHLSDSPDVILCVRQPDQLRVVADISTFEHIERIGSTIPLAKNRPSVRALL